MEEEEKLKSIRIELDYADADGNAMQKIFTIKVNKVKDVSESGIGYRKRLYSMSFSLVIPEHYYETLIGQEIPIFEMGKRNEFHSYNSLTKTITRDDLKTLCDFYFRILQDYCWLKKKQKANLQKVIFYDFENKSGKYSSDWDGLNFGTKSKLDFTYCIGYLSPMNVRYNDAKVMVKETQNREYYRLSHVIWSQEREDFFNQIDGSFKNIVNKINIFKSQLNEDTINTYISDNTKLLPE